MPKWVLSASRWRWFSIFKVLCHGILFVLLGHGSLSFFAILSKSARLFFLTLLLDPIKTRNKKRYLVRPMNEKKLSALRAMFEKSRTRYARILSYIFVNCCWHMVQIALHTYSINNSIHVYSWITCWGNITKKKQKKKRCLRH